MHSKLEKIMCPTCGYYCSGRGGYGCIDKPSLVFKDTQADLIEKNDQLKETNRFLVDVIQNATVAVENLSEEGIFTKDSVLRGLKGALNSSYVKNSQQ